MNAREFARQRARLEQRFTGRRLKSALARLAREAKADPVIIAGRQTGYAMRTGEQVCIKRRYQSRETAERELALITPEIIDGMHVPIRSYQCKFCRGWHLTSQLRQAA